MNDSAEIYAPTERSRVRRSPKRASYDRDTVHAIIDQALVCHVGFVAGGAPRVLPTAIARIGECVYVHGNRHSTMLRALESGAPACITVTHLDGLVVARSAFHSSMNYRSVVIHACGHAVHGARKRRALDALVESLIPGRTGDVRPPTAEELAITSVIEFPLEEVSAKTRSGPPIDSKDDYVLPFWGGVVPLRTVAGAPASDDAAVRARIAPPTYLARNMPRTAVDGERPRAAGRHAERARALARGHGESPPLRCGTATEPQGGVAVKLGFVTYQIGAEWDVPTLISMCNAAGMSGVELRTTHAHGVEVELSAAERAEVRQRFADGGVDIAGLGSAFEYHAVDPAVVRENIDGTIAYAKLAADLGCPGIKVRPNGLQTEAGIPEEKTLEQIGLAVRECAQAAADLGVAVRVEVHGRETQEPRRMRTIIDHADHDNAYLCWNSNPGEPVNGSIDEAYGLLRHKIGLVHINELHTDYPWRDLFTKLHRDGYTGYTLAEIQGNADGERLLRYYRALWEAYQPPATA